MLLSRLFPSRRPEVRLLVWLALVLLASGLFHVVVWLVDGAAPLVGPVSWRKPIVFGLSSGLTTASLAWIVSLLSSTRGVRVWTRVYAVTMATEIALIDLQQWRGVGSHFNIATAFDGVVFGLMGALILVSAAATVFFTVALWRARDVDVASRAAALGALGLLHASVLVGIGMVAHGQMVQLAHEGVPAVVAGRGLLKVPHGIGLHGLQVLPLLAWLLSRAGVSAAESAAWIGRATSGLALVMLAALLGALAGRAPLDPPVVAVVVAVAGVGVLVVVVGRLLLAFAQVRSAAEAA